MLLICKFNALHMRVVAVDLLQDFIPGIRLGKGRTSRGNDRLLAEDRLRDLLVEVAGLDHADGGKILLVKNVVVICMFRY